MSFLRRILSGPKPPPARKPAPPPDVPTVVAKEVFKGRERSVEVVGERYREGNIARIVGPKRARGVWQWTTGSLMPEANNPHDKNAVAAFIQDIHVGYLPREKAVAFRKHMHEKGLDGHGLTGFKAKITSGFKDADGSETSYQVTLYLPEEIALDLKT